MKKSQLADMFPSETFHLYKDKILHNILPNNKNLYREKMENDTVTHNPQTNGHAGPDSRAKKRRERLKELRQKTSSMSSARWFGMLVAAIFLFHGILVQYSYEVISHVGKRYAVPGYEQGFILGLEKIGLAIMLILMAFFGNRVHRPVTIAVGGILTAVGATFCSAAYFISGALEQESSTISNFLLTGICRKFIQNATLSQNQCFFSNVEENRSWPYSMLCLGQFLIGVGSALYASIALVHIEENTKPRESAVFIGCALVMHGIGQFVGSVLATGFSSISESGRRDEKYLVSELQRVGSWWLGFPIIAAFMLLVATGFFWFPRWFIEPAWLKRRKDRLEEKVLSQKIKIIASKHKKHSHNNGKKKNSSSSKSGSPSTSKNKEPNNKAKPTTVTSGVDVIRIPDPALVHVPTGSDKPTYREETETRTELGSVETVSEDLPRIQEGDEEGSEDLASTQEGDQEGSEDLASTQEGDEEESEDQTGESQGQESQAANVDGIQIAEEGVPNPAFEMEISTTSQQNLQAVPNGVQKTKKSSGYKKKQQKRSKRSTSSHKSSKSSSSKRYITARKHRMRREELRDLPRHLWRLLRNIPLLLTFAASVVGTYVVSGYAYLLPTYMEVQFQQDATTASVGAAVVGPLGCAVGVLVGTILIYKMEWKLYKASKMVVVSLAVSVILLAILMAVSCAQPDYKYDLEKKDALSQGCNSDCDCTGTQYDPVCGSDGITYFSPCHAGCLAIMHNSRDIEQMNYTQCSCVGNGGFASYGVCKSKCSVFYLYVFLGFITMATACMGHVVSLLIFLRIVRDRYRSLSIGLGIWIIYLLGYVLGHVVFGRARDSQCLIWKEDCYEEDTCWLYDVQNYRYIHHGVAMSTQTLACVLFVGVCYQLRPTHTTHNESKDEETSLGAPPVSNGQASVEVEG